MTFKPLCFAASLALMSWLSLFSQHASAQTAPAPLPAVAPIAALDVQKLDRTPQATTQH